MELYHNADLEFFVDDYYDDFDDEDFFTETGSPRSADYDPMDSEFDDEFESV